MAKTLDLRFNTANGKTMSLTIQNPKENLTASEIKNAMQTIINQNIFKPGDSELVSIQQAQIVERNVSQIEIV